MRFFLTALLFAALAGCGLSSPDSSGHSAQPLPFAPPPPPLPERASVCAQDVQLCPGGGSVSRNPARDCAFDACPSAITP